jgi:hypothetical protein
VVLNSGTHLAPLLPGTTSSALLKVLVQTTALQVGSSGDVRLSVRLAVLVDGYEHDPLAPFCLTLSSSISSCGLEQFHLSQGIGMKQYACRWRPRSTLALLGE